MSTIENILAHLTIDDFPPEKALLDQKFRILYVYWASNIDVVKIYDRDTGEQKHLVPCKVGKMDIIIDLTDIVVDSILNTRSVKGSYNSVTASVTASATVGIHCDKHDVYSAVTQELIKHKDKDSLRLFEQLGMKGEWEWSYILTTSLDKDHTEKPLSKCLHGHDFPSHFLEEIIPVGLNKVGKSEWFLTSLGAIMDFKKT